MAGSKFGFGVIFSVVLGAGGWVGCSQGDEPPQVVEVVGTTRQHLDPGWTPGSLSPAAWYVAASADVVASGGAISQWSDRSGNGRHATQATSVLRPQLNPTGWNGADHTVHFDGSDFLTVDGWSGSPAGTNAPFTVMAVLRSGEPQDAAVTGWWDPGGSAFAWAELKNSNGLTLLDVTRTYQLSRSQMYTAPHDLGTMRHVVAWRYLPSSQTFKLTVDGTTTTSNAFAPIANLVSMPLIIGARSTLATGYFNGDISELVIAQAALSDTDVQNFTEYARLQWSGLPTTGSDDPCIDASGNPTSIDVRCDYPTGATYGDHCSAGSCTGSAPAAGSPAELSPIAWYHAGPAEVSLKDGLVATWFDRTTNHLDLAQGFYYGRPSLVVDGWNDNKPTIRFSGGNLLRREAWTGVPGGSDAAFSVLAVLRSSASQSAAVAAWSNQSGYSKAWCQLKAAGGDSTLDLYRQDETTASHELLGTLGLGTSRHVVAWRYSPEVIKLTVDGATAEVTRPSLDALTLDALLIGAANDFANTLFRGDISELAVVPGSISDAAVNNFRNYAQEEWGGLCVSSCGTEACGSADGCGGTCECSTCTTNSQCAPGFSCLGGTCGTCALNPSAPECSPPHCSNSIKDGDETDVNCGGSCVKCTTEKQCATNADCGDGLVCGEHNGGCFSGSRGSNVCWPAACGDGVDATECGSPESLCGQNCACVKGCNADAPSGACASGDVCREGLGTIFSAPTRDVCIPNGVICPSNDPAYCGTEWSICGPFCIAMPDCSQATCENPSDGAGGLCPGVCADGGSGGTAGQCTDDMVCSPGSSCRTDGNGLRFCRREDLCPPGRLRPPLCGSPSAPCGAVCPTCTPRCDDRECGNDPVCGESCGSCGGGTFCNPGGKCVQSTDDPAPSVPDGDGGQVPLEDLPTSPANPLGAVKGAFSVSEGGTAEYDIPIEVPPGRAGLAPTLSLHYTGANRYGDQGVGWRLEGLSRITRCPRTQAFDGYASPIKDDPTDQFCLDGQRLVATTGDYGKDGTQYRTAVDTFSKVTSRNDPDGQAIQVDASPNVTQLERSKQGPDYFEVRTREGRTLTFGHKADSVGIKRNGLRYAWLLNRVTDRAGNTIVVHYETYNNSTSSFVDDDKVVLNAIYPVSITYTGHGETEGNRSVLFSYEPRTDYSYLRFQQGGVGTFNLHRLRGVTTAVDNKSVRTYQLHYADQYVSQMDAIKECAGDGSDPAQCKPATTFEYTEESGFSPSSGVASELDASILLDANGDGRKDFFHTYVTVDGVSGLPVGYSIASVVVSEVGSIAIGASLSSGIGAPFGIAFSLIVSDFFGSFAHEPVVHYNNVVTFSTPGRNITSAAASGLPCLPGSPMFPLDYNQDGKDDLFGICNYGVPDVVPGLALSVSQGDGHFSPVTLPPDIVNLLNPIYAQYGDQPWAAPTPIFYDVDGDGLQDIVSCPTNYAIQMRRRSSATASFEAPITLASPVTPTEDGAPPPPPPAVLPFCESSRPTYNIMDVDGDGVADLLVAAFGNWYVLRYVKNGTTPALKFEPITFTNTAGSTTGQGLKVGDYNGDGLPDVASLNGATATVWINTGGGKFLSRALTRPLPGEQAQTLGEHFKYKRAAVLDYNADGRADFLEHWQTGAGYGYNVALTPDANVSELPYTVDDAIRYPNATNFMEVGNFTTPTDMDGDGNIDLLGPQGIYFGSGAKNTLLKRVVDGLGNVTRVTYDGYASECTGSNWPETCLRSMSGVVGRQEIGFIEDGQDVIEKSYLYSFKNARVNVAGAGWLGFESRVVQEADTSTFRTTTTEYEPPARYGLDAALRTDTNPGYVYPLAGHVRRTTTVQNTFESPSTPMPLESAAFEQITSVENHWAVAESAAGLPFAKLDAREATLSVREVDPPVVGTPPPPHDAVVVSSRGETFQTDGYGNVHYARAADYTEVTTTTTEFDPPDETNWIVSNPHLVTIESGTNSAAPRTRQWLLGYDTRGLLEVVTRAPNGPVDQQHVTTYVRDEFGNAYQIVEAVMTGEPARTTQITFDADHVYPLTIINALNQESQVRYDERWGMLKSAVDPNGIAEQRSFDALGLPITAEDENGTTTYAYSALPPVAANGALPLGSIHPRLRVTRTRAGVEQTQTGTTSEEFDNYGRLVRTSSTGFENTTVFKEQVYDRRGRLFRESLPHTSASDYPFTTYSYDPIDRLIGVQHSDGLSSGGTTEEMQYANWATLAPQYWPWFQNLSCGYAFGCALNVVLTKDGTASGHKNVTLSDHRGHVMRSIDGNNVDQTERYTSYVYAGFDQLVTVFDNDAPDSSAIGNADFDRIRTNFGYDPYGRLLGHWSMDTGTSLTSYNGFDEPSTTTDANGNFRVYTHDGLGRIKAIVDGDRTTSWTYDEGVNAIGRLSSMTSPGTTAYANGQTVEYEYEPVASRNRGLLRQLTYTLDGVEHELGYQYDDLGRTRQIDYPNLGQGPAISAKYSYDSSGALAAVQELNGGTTKPLWALSEAFQGYRTKKETYGNSVTTTYGYNAARHWLESIDTALPSQSIQNISYTHYANGQVNVRTKLDGTHTLTRQHTYDNLMRLAATEDRVDNGLPQLVGYGYDNLGNLTQYGGNGITHQLSRPHLVDTVGQNEYGYDANGNVNQRTGPDVPGGSQVIFYTPFDLPDSIYSGVQTYFEYTADEQRVIRRDPDQTRYFASELYERATDSTTGATLEERFRFYAGGRELGQLVRKNGTDQTLFFHTDNLGTVDTMTTDQGAVLQQQFESFGAESSPLNPQATRAGFTGQAHDRDLGFIDMRGRIYDPLAGRFAQPDPVMQAPYWSQGLNRYAYVFNDPINNTDPSGFISFNDVASTIVGGAVAVGWAASAIIIGAQVSGPVSGAAFTATAGSITAGLTLPNGAQPGIPTTAVTNPQLQGGAPQNSGAFAGDHDPVPCGLKGNPSCGDPVKRAVRLSERGRALDQLAREFLNLPSSDPGLTGLTIADATRQLGVEHGAALILRPDGTLRFGTVSTGSSRRVDIDFNLGKGEKIAGAVHTHPTGGVGSDFSRLDIRTSSKFGKGFLGSYVASQGAGASDPFNILVFEPRLNLITSVP